MARHDAKRQAAAPGSTDLAAPVAFWRKYLGGAISAGQLLTTDVNGDGRPDVVLASSGQVVAKGTDDQVFWRTAPRGIVALAAVSDLDGDGNLDIVAYSSDHVYIVAAKTGALEWTEPDGEMGTIGSVRVGDVTGDGKPDVVIAECGCCGANSGKSGFIWSFGSGFSTPQSLGTLPVFSCGTSYSITLVSPGGNGPLDILMADYKHFALVKSDGTVLAQTSTLGTWTAVNRCVAANLDGVPGDEMVCLLNSSDAPSTSQRKVTVLHYNPAASPATLDVLWSANLAPDTGGDLRWVDPVVDLDGDGKMELVVSSLDPALGWQTRIFDALTGTEFTPAIGGGAIIAGTAAMEAPNRRLVLTTGVNVVAITAWSFTRAPQPGVSQKWMVPNASLMTYSRPDLIPTGAITLAAVELDLNGDGRDDIVTSRSSGGGVDGFSGAGGVPKSVASLTLPPSTDPLYAWVLPAISTPTPQIGLAGTDGILSLLSGGLQPTAQPSDPAKVIAIGTGGYYATGAWRELAHTPRVASLDGGKSESIVVNDSRQALLRFDPASASWAVPPRPVWASTHTYGPTIVPGLDGNQPGIACLAVQEPVTTPPQYRTRLLHADGTAKWDVPMASTPLTDFDTGTFNADGVPDLVVQWNAPGTPTITTRAVSGADGSTIWETPPVDPGVGGFQSAGVSVGRWNGDAFDDVYYQGSATRILSGADGSQLAQGGPINAYSLPLLLDPTGGGVDDVLLSAGYWPASLYSHDLQTAVWTSTDDDRPYPYGAIAQCGVNPATPMLVEGSWANPARLKVTPLAGGSLGTFATVVLANGKEYANEAAAKADGAFLGQLTSANVHANLTGAGHPSAVVGSADGWLYAFNPCTRTLDFAINLGASVGEAVFGDTNGDGRDEILVTAADGYLYDVRNQDIAAPAYVWDTDPDHGIGDHDVDSIVTTDKLSAVWAAVPAATGFEVTVVTKEGIALPNPVWKTVGTVTSASLTGLPLQDGTEYFFAVHALSATGQSVDALSNGVKVHFPLGADAGLEGGAPDASPGGGGPGSDGGGNHETAGSSGGCGCRFAGSPTERQWLLSLLTMALVLVGRWCRPRCSL